MESTDDLRAKLLELDHDKSWLRGFKELGYCSYEDTLCLHALDKFHMGFPIKDKWLRFVIKRIERIKELNAL